jgi:beta-glucosidase
MDVELHVPQGFNSELCDWFADGRADVALLNRAVREVLTAKFRMGLFEFPFAPDVAGREGEFRTADPEVAMQAARESLVLLRNDGVLPLQPGIPKLAVIGCHASSARFFFGGYTHYSMAEGMLAENSSMAGLTTRTDDLKEISNTIPGTSIEASDASAFEELLQRQQPGIRTLLDELRARLPDTQVDWSYGYPIAGDDTSAHEEAIALAASADIVLLTLGGKHGTASIASMGEGVDATNINLPPCQEDLITKLAQLGKPMIGVHLDGRPVSSDVADSHLTALLEAWSPAEGGAEAIVDILVGAHGPSGRLPISVARSSGQVPVYYNHPFGSAWHQGESIGFPDYVDSPHTPRYPFGYGMSYTSFEYADLRLSKQEVQIGDTIDVTLTVLNSGDAPGTEVVQLYVRDQFASVSRPALELAGFRRIALEPGETAQVEFHLDVSQLAFLDADLQWCVEAGVVDLMVGASSEDLRLTDRFWIAADAAVDGAIRSYYA